MLLALEGKIVDPENCNTVLKIEGYPSKLPLGRGFDRGANKNSS